jgi:hypothetical protein
MEPTSFQFTVSMPGDARLVEVIRSVTAQATTYAKLSGDQASAFQQQVADATAEAIRASDIKDAPLQFEFKGSVDALTVAMTWPANGTRARRELRQTLSA